MRPAPKLLLIATAGALTTAVAALFMAVVLPTPGVLFAAAVVVLLAAGSGIGAVVSAPAPTSRRSALLSIAAFAAGMILAIGVVAAWAGFTSVDVEPPARHGVVWPLFAVLFVATFLLSMAAFSVAAFVTSAIVGRRS